MDKTLDAIATFVHETSADTIPNNVLDHARDILVDSLGCAIGGSDSPAARVVATWAPRLAGVGDAPVIGRDQLVPAELAAFWNAAMIRSLDFNDAGPTGGHPSDMIGGHIALSGQVAASGRDLLVAIVIGHEVFNRVSDRVLYDDRRLDYGYGTAIGLAAAGSYLLGLDPEQTRHAVSFAATSSVSLRAARAGQLSNLKGFASALGIKEAVFHLSLARSGLTAPVAPFEGRHGIVELLAGKAGSLDLPSFGDWTILGSRLKYYPAAYNTQPAIWAGLALREKVDPTKIASVTLGVNNRAWHESGSEPAKWDPQSRETADHSIPYLFSRALVDGVLNDDSYTPEKLRDPLVRQVMSKVSVVVDPAMEEQRPKLVLGCRAVAQDISGVKHESLVDGIPGDATTWLTKDQIAEKFLGLTGAKLGQRAESAFETAWSTGSLGRFSDVLEALTF